MPGDPLWINASGGVPAYSAQELRQAMALALMYDGRTFGGRQGVRPGGTALSVSLVGSTITVQPGACHIDPGITSLQGGYWVAIPAAENHTLTVADATNPRKDIVIARVYDHDHDSSGNRFAETDYIAGTAAAVPAEPALPAGAIKLAVIDVPFDGNGPAVVTDRRTWTVATGGILPVAGASDIAAALEGRYRDRLDTNVLERDTGAVWETIGDPQLFKAWLGTWVPVWTNLTVGNGVLVTRQQLMGKTLDFHFTLVLGTTSVVGSLPSFTLPANLHSSYFATNCKPKLGWASASDASTNNYDLSLRAAGSGTPSTVEIVTIGTNGLHGAVNSTTPFNWATGDCLSGGGRVELA